MTKISLIIKTFFLITFLIFSCFSFGIIQAGVNDNVSGWIWSENIGWISLNNITDPDSGAVDYGVNIDVIGGSGLFSGHAWSEHVGWISFNRSETGTPPAPPYNSGGETYTACLNLPGPVAQVCDGIGIREANGWARVLNPGAGWDGWVSLKGSSPDYGVSYDNVADELEGWAWSDDFGWISFNCDTDPDCSGSTYGGLANLNLPPVADISCDHSLCHNNNNPTYDCVGYTGCVFKLVNESDDPDPGDSIDYTEWDVYSWGADPDLDCSSKCDFAPSGLSPNNYTVEIYVEDQDGASDTATKDFTIYQEAIANFMCSLTNEPGSWQDCRDISLSEGEVIYFKDDPDYGLTSGDSSYTKWSTPSDGATTITFREWAISQDGGSFIVFSPGGDNEMNPFTTLGQGSVAIKLTIKDDNSRTGARTVSNATYIDDYTIEVKAPPPEWKEVSPLNI